MSKITYPESSGIGNMLLKKEEPHEQPTDCMRVMLQKIRSCPTGKITFPDDVVTLMREMKDMDRERAMIIHLNTKNNIIGVENISTGSLNASIIHPREAIKGAILNNSSNIIFIHNHPSGDPGPSVEDRAINKKLQEAFNIVGIDMLDAIIIGKKGYYSAREHGELFPELKYKEPKNSGGIKIMESKGQTDTDIAKLVCKCQPKISSINSEVVGILWNATEGLWEDARASVEHSLKPNIKKLEECLHKKLDYTNEMVETNIINPIRKKNLDTLLSSMQTFSSNYIAEAIRSVCGGKDWYERYYNEYIFLEKPIADEIYKIKSKLKSGERIMVTIESEEEDACSTAMTAAMEVITERCTNGIAETNEPNEGKFLRLHLKQEIKTVHTLALRGDSSVKFRAENTVKQIDLSVDNEMISSEYAKVLKSSLQKALQKKPYLDVMGEIGY